MLIFLLLAKISVICPTYARADRHEAIYNAFHNQTHADKEFLILDDSPKPSPFFTQLKDPQVHYKHISQRLSIGMKRNELVKMASGEIIAHFDDDDHYAPNYLAFMLNALGERDFVKLSKWRALRELDNSLWEWDATELPKYCVSSNTTGYFPVDAEKVARQDPTFSIEKMMEKNLWGYGFSYVYRREVGLAHPFPDLSACEDLAFFESLRISCKCSHVPDNDHLVIHTLHPESTSRIFPQKQI